MLGPMPIAEKHQYFKMIVIEENENRIFKYEVDWNYSHSYK